MAVFKLSGWPLGMVNAAGEQDIPSNALASAQNCDVEPDGSIRRRVAYGNRLSTSATSSLFEHNGKIYGVVAGELGEISASGFTPMRLAGSKVSWAVVNNEAVACSSDGLFAMRGTSAVQLGVPQPNFASVSSATGGTLQCAGRYAVSVAYVNRSGEESGSTHPEFVSCNVGDSIHVNFPSSLDPDVVKVRIYRTHADGTILYHAEDAPVGAGLAVLGEADLGKPAETVGHRRMMGGQAAAYWRGRSLVAYRSTLFYSDALRYGTYDPARNFVELDERIAWIAPVEGGVFLGLRSRVVFLSGATPDEWTLRTVSGTPSQGVVALIHSQHIGIDDFRSMGIVAVWLSEYGFALGTPTGEVVFPQFGRVQGIAPDDASIFFHEGRLVALFE